MDDLSDLYAEVIMDHQRHPRNFGKLESFDREVQMTNSSCGDQISLQVKFENEKIKDLKFTGMGCAISMASASVMTEVMKGLSIEEAKRFSDEFLEMVKAGKTPSDDLKDAKVFEGVHKYPMRVKCATLAWHALQKAME
ncbi:Fe-S cluster assembly sulfur transfer protein SufU [Athalassotoga sp.]|uniref:Fe-S cluster assembly sulfur transfer protein SufU n=1 Tax=Athalassotoga sp. TaxID=2022597 RepID=UPI003D005392